MRSFLRGAFFEALSLNALSKQWWAQNASDAALGSHPCLKCLYLYSFMKCFFLRD